MGARSEALGFRFWVVWAGFLTVAWSEPLRAAGSEKSEAAVTSTTGLDDFWAQPNLPAGMRLLSELARDPKTAERRLERFHEVSGLWGRTASAARALIQEQREALTASLPDTASDFLLDPWGGVDQVPGGYPRTVVVIGVDGTQFRYPPKGFLRDSIPAPYRLAEYLGLGKNHFISRPRYAKPHLFFGQLDSYEIHCRIYQQFYGEFRDSEGLAPIETFRCELRSQGFVNAVEIRMSREVKPHHFSLGEFTIEESHVTNPHSPYRQENMADQFPARAVSIRPSQSDLERMAPYRAQVLASLRAALASYQDEITDTVVMRLRSNPDAVQLLEALASLRTTLRLHHESHPKAPCRWPVDLKDSEVWLEDLVRAEAKRAVPSADQPQVPPSVRLAWVHQLFHQLDSEHRSEGTEVAWQCRLLLNHSFATSEASAEDTQEIP